MHKFVRGLITEWRRLELPIAGETVIVAVSGGADSVSLLLGLNELKKASKLNLKIVAAHLNHQLRGVESQGAGSAVGLRLADFGGPAELDDLLVDQC